ncbi:hypothetical protein SDRG_11393 [Saprolegnia diclina VS20]|uniref:Uncharacterized protein n=1 Tax=Saprolegnia diclina (strain VS20) TaxID=1156394 RepID=T0PZB8_SAPDV|nr:hypothetical protein SDRG_11393 [Saprolegnia diclina VS20]EQC30914.1 hypothetical protein SDRG_11393 [Saprolegnia diclina VS20]|eukprot:XP_008615652.1 hypothetical protein SDRG_11393 [Saprolegnia diclina VS20]
MPGASAPCQLSKKAIKRKLQRRNRERYLELRAMLTQRILELEGVIELRRAVPALSWQDVADELRWECARSCLENLQLRHRVNQCDGLVVALTHVTVVQGMTALPHCP